MSKTAQDDLPAALVFDLDGTLVDSVGSVAAAVNAAITAEGLMPLTIEQTKEHVGEGALHMISSVLTSGGMVLEDTLVQRCVERYIAAYLDDPATHTTIFPGVVDVLEDFHRCGITMGVCTNKPGMLAKAVLHHLSLRRFFCAVVSPDDTEHRKPDGRHIHATLREMKVFDKTAILIGDSETDVLAGSDAGLKTILLTHGYRRGPIAEERADIVIDNFADLPDAVRSLTRMMIL